MKMYKEKKQAAEEGKQFINQKAKKRVSFLENLAKSSNTRYYLATILIGGVGMVGALLLLQEISVWFS